MYGHQGQVRALTGAEVGGELVLQRGEQLVVACVRIQVHLALVVQCCWEPRSAGSCSPATPPAASVSSFSS
jgi:hypothetical protein